MQSANKITFFMFALAIATFPFCLHASGGLSFTEVAYDLPGTDADHEWVEIKNTSGSPITIVGGSGAGSFRFFDGSNHVLASTALKGSITIEPSGFLLLAGNADTFLLDYPSFSGNLVDTTMSLGNEGDTLKIIDGEGNIVDTYTYTSASGANGDGNSLQFNSGGAWVSAIPTPGADTVAGSGGGTTGGGSGGGSVGGGSQTQTKTDTKATEIPKMKSVIVMQDSVVAGIKTKIRGDVFGYLGELRSVGIFKFSLGDGSTYSPEYNENFYHTYEYPGTYIVRFIYTSNPYNPEPELVANKVVEVIDPSVSIVGFLKNGAIEIKNNGDRDADISGWILKDASNASSTYTFPDGMSVIAGRSIFISSSITHFVYKDDYTISLGLPSGQIVSENSSNILKNKIVVQNHSTTSESVVLNKNQNINHAKDNEVKFENAKLTASALSATDAKHPSDKKRDSSLVFIIGFIGVIASSIFILYRFNQKHGQEFDHVEERKQNTETKKIADSIRILDDEEEVS